MYVGGAKREWFRMVERTWAGRADRQGFKPQLLTDWGFGKPTYPSSLLICELVAGIRPLTELCGMCKYLSVAGDQRATFPRLLD